MTTQTGHIPRRRTLAVVGLVLAITALVGVGLFRLELFGWLLPESTVMVVNESGSAIADGALEIEGRLHPLGVIPPGQSRRFAYRWRGREGDFGLKVQLQSGVSLEGRVGYVSDLFYVGGQLDEVFVTDSKICMKTASPEAPADATVDWRAQSDAC